MSAKPAKPKRAPPRAPVAKSSLYDGGEYLGDIVECAGEFRAIGRTGRSLGKFGSLKECSRAICQAASVARDRGR